MTDAAEARDLGAECDAIYNEIRRTTRVREEWLSVPSPVIERLMWQVAGGWEQVAEEVRFFNYLVKDEPDAIVLANRDKVAKDMRRIARRFGLRIPEGWTEKCKSVQEIRNNLGHMLYIVSIDGEAPNRSVSFRRVPYLEPGEMKTEGGWISHNRVLTTYTERELVQALADLRWLKDCLFALRKFGHEFADWRDDRSITQVSRILPWWLPEWGEPGSRELFMRDLRVQPNAAI